MLLRQWGATTEHGHPSYAGLLALRVIPQLHSAAARVGYRRLPRRADPAGTRHCGRHLEGTVGALLEDAVAAITADLTVVQVVRGGAVVDQLDGPGEVLREVLSNALIHRSLADGQRDAGVTVQVSDEAVVVTSPGGLHHLVDTATLGLTAMSGVRNLSLVRLCEQLRTPAGARIVEHQNSGIAAAGQASHRAGSMPVLFVDRPATFQAIVLRGAPGPGAAPLAGAGVVATASRVRLLAVLACLEHLCEDVAVTGLGRVFFDARLAARSLAPCSVEDAAAELRALADAGVLRRTHTRLDPGWLLLPGPPVTAHGATGSAGTTEPAPRTPVTVRPRRGRPPGDRVPELLSAIAGTGDGVLSAKGSGEALQLSSPGSRHRWIHRAVAAPLIASTVENPFDPTGGYALPPGGRQVLAAEQRTTPTG